MAKKQPVKIDTLSELTEKLAEVRYSMADYDRQYDEIMAPLTKEREELEEQILAELRTTGLHSTPESSHGEYFIRSVDTKFAVVDEKKAEAWAEKMGALRLDKTRANSILRRIPRSEVPPCFEVKEEEKLSIKRPQDGDTGTAE